MQYFINNKPREISNINALYLDKIVELCEEKELKLVLLNTII